METVNPYQAPEGDLSVEGEGFGEIKFFDSKCRIGRLRYLAHGGLMALGFYAILAVLFGVVSLTGGFAEGNTTAIGIVGVITIPVYIAFVVFWFITMIQRLHDLNKSGWFLLLMFVPLANLWLALYMLFGKGTQGPNDFGNPPPPNKTWHWWAGLIFPVIFTVGILAAIALPAYQTYTERAAAAAVQ